MKQCITILLLFISISTFATHNRAGEITYRQISAYTYEITLITYTYTPSYANASRDVLPIDWGDGTMSNIPRIEKVDLPDYYSKNTYKMIHTFPGPGNYVIIMEDPNRNQGVVNIFDSVNIPFSIKTTLRIDPIVGYNNTPVLLNPPVDKAALHQRFVHNPAAYDSDGDSLAYRLTQCTGQNGEPIPNYTYPDASKSFYVDSITGDMVWDSPVELGIYNVAMVVEEWRKGVKIGEVERDIQIEVFDSKNHTPEFDSIPNFCVRAGDTVRFMVHAKDIDNNKINLIASGGPLDMVANKAHFDSQSGTGDVSSEFVWVPQCEEVRQQPYTVLFKATDLNTDISLAGFLYVSISVIGHSPVDLQANSQSVSVNLSWKDSLCNNEVSYNVYRSRQSTSHVTQYCETGLPQDLAPSYKFVARVDSSKISYFDNNHGIGLSPGFTYCYRMVSNYVDSFPSYISDEICVELKPSFPVITNVSVNKTDALTGEVFVAWSKPREFDSIVFPKPYQYKLYRSYGMYGANPELISTIDGLNDTTFTDVALSTQDSAVSYLVEFYSLASGSPILIGAPPVCSSPFLSGIPMNKKVALHLQTQVGWENDTVYVFRKQQNTNLYDSLGIFRDGEFVDTGLVNLQSYCYYVKTSGYFESSALPARVYNYSQIACVIPQDTIPPKSPKFTIVQNCDEFSRTITWKRDTLDEIQKVFVYFKDCRASNFVKIATLLPNVTSYIHIFSDTTRNMAGCYYIAQLDSAGNESIHSFDSCMYNCPMYVLPNIFTPNGDGKNDVYHPFKNRFVEKVDMKIYDSWGNLVFESKNPELNWNGYNQQSGKPSDDGVFYYVCDVYEYWADCNINPRTLVGFIHKFSEGKNILIQNE